MSNTKLEQNYCKGLSTATDFGKTRCTIENKGVGWIVPANNGYNYLNRAGKWWNCVEIGVSTKDAVAGYGPYSTYFPTELDAQLALDRAEDPPQNHYPENLILQRSVGASGVINISKIVGSGTALRKQ